MKKKKIISGFLILALMPMLMLLSSCHTGIVGNGDVEERNESIDRFDRLYISGHFDVHLTQTRRPELRFEMDENLYDVLRIRESGRTLTIDTDVHIIRAKRKDIYIGIQDIDRLDLSGAVELRTKGLIELESLVLISSGATKVVMEIKTERLKLDMSGASDCRIDGETNDLVVRISGAGDFNSMDMLADFVDVNISGAGHALVFAEEDLDVSISGVGSVRYRGDPKVTRDISGIGSLKRD